MMEYEEKLERALRMRSRDLFGAVTPEELAAYPAEQTELWVETYAGKVHIYQLTPENRPQNGPMLLNFHGGGFIKGRQDKDRLFCSRLALEFGCLVWDVDYSLAPESVFPTAVEESLGVAEYVRAHAGELGIDPERIVLLGHSAGGNLACTVCMKGSFRPAALIIEYCPMDLATDPAEKPRVESDMPAGTAKLYNAFYCEPEAAKNPLVSPLFAPEEQLARFPDTLVLSAGLDSLCYEDEEFAMKLARAGVTVTSRRFRDSLHGFTLNRNGEWEAGCNLIETFIRQHIRKEL